MYLDKENGGVNMPILRNILMSKQIKSIYKILISDNAHWNMIAKSWLRKFDDQYNDHFFLCKCSNIKGLDTSDLPVFYQCAEISWVNFQSKMKICDKSSILNLNLFGNINICIRNTPPFYQDFSTCNIKTVQDIWNINTKSFHDETLINNKLDGSRNWRQKYNKIKNNIPDRWVNILKEDIPESLSAGLSITQNLKIYLNGKYIEPHKLKLKILHNFLLDETYKPKSEIKWETLFDRDFNWKMIWRASREVPCSNKEKQFHWKITHNAIFTEHRLQLMNFSNGLCHFCRAGIEDVGHLFSSCPISKEIIDRLQNKMNGIINTYFNCSIHLQSNDSIIGYLHENKNIRIFVNFILHISKWELWKIRNNIKHENQTFTKDKIVDIIVLKISNATRFVEKTNIENKFKTIINMVKSFE